MTDERVFLITGASSGIGAATARAAAAEGHRLVLAARSIERLESLAAEVGGPSQAIAVACDVTDFDSQLALVERAIETFGQLDIVFANAGFGGGRSLGPDCEDSPQRWREMLLTNVLGAAFTIRASFEAITRSRGHVLITSSVIGRKVMPGSFYSATKWGVSGLAEALRLQLNSTGVRVTLVAPGITDTPFFAAIGDSPFRPDAALAPEDIARAVMWAIAQPTHVDVNELLIRPTGQLL